MFWFSTSLGKIVPENIRSIIESPESQTDMVISYIYRHPKCPRNELIDLRFEGMRIANLTARVSNAREKLRPLGYDIKCDIVSTRRVWKHMTKLTEYSLIFLNVSE